MERFCCLSKLRLTCIVRNDQILLKYDISVPVYYSGRAQTRARPRRPDFLVESLKRAGLFCPSPTTLRYLSSYGEHSKKGYYQICPCIDFHLLLCFQYYYTSLTDHNTKSLFYFIATYCCPKFSRSCYIHYQMTNNNTECKMVGKTVE